MEDIISRSYDPDMRHWGVFSGARLTVARQRRSFTRKALAEAIGVLAPAVTQFEKEYNRPKLDTVFRIASALQYPVEFFFAPDLDIMSDEVLSFRARRSMTASLRGKMTACGVLAADVVSKAIHQRFSLPETDLIDLGNEPAEHAAALLRKHWRLGQGPINNMVHMLESHGVDVYWVDEDSSSIDALSFWQDGRPFVLLNVFKKAGERGRFDAAHELGHLVLHRDRSDTSSQQAEAEANQFASAFLLPAEQFRAESPKTPMLINYEVLKRRWMVSIGAMVRRSRDLGLISEWQYETACKEISARGYRANVPGEPGRLPRESSRIHQLVFERLGRKGITPSRFARDMRLPLDELKILMPWAQIYEDKVLLPDPEYDLKNLPSPDVGDSSDT